MGIGMRRVIIDIPHSGRVIPDDWVYHCSEACLRRGEDRFIDLIIEESGINAQDILIDQFNRVYLDVNSRPNDVILKGRMCATAFHAQRGRGFVWSWCHQSYVNSIDVREYMLRVQRVYIPYVSILRKMLLDKPIWIQLHSMEGSSRHGEHPEVCLGSLHGCSAKKEWLDACYHFWHSRGYQTKMEWPFSGGYLLKSLHTLADKALQVEFNKSLYLTANDKADMRKVNRLRRDFTRFVTYLQYMG